jgi:hypothetical protein
MFLTILTTMPPGGYVYDQTAEDGSLIKRYTTTTMPFGEFCKPIVELRKANGLPRASKAETHEDVSLAQCARLGNDSAWCGGNGYRPVAHEERRGCASCGVILNQ